MPAETAAPHAVGAPLSAGAPEPVLRVAGLGVAYRSASGPPLAVVRGVSFEVAAGEALGILGESGCGKSTLCLTLTALLPPGGFVTAGAAFYRGRDLLRLSPRELESVRGAQIATIFQEPGLALNPCLRVGAQVEDVLLAHRPWRRQRARARALELLDRVRFRDPVRIHRAYPHELSGGQQQRVVIAQALACDPALVLADEATASLDTATQSELIELLRGLLAERGTALVFVSHDPAVLAGLADRLAVMYAGRLVELGPRDEVLERPLHPYTRALLACVPPQEAPAAGGRRPLPVIAGSDPDPRALPPGCAFEPRCPERLAACSERPPPLAARPPDRRVACVLYESGGSG